MKTGTINNSIIVIAGGGGGIGSAAAAHLASRGATVVLIGHGASRNKGLLRKITPPNPRHMCIDADLRSFDAWSKLFGQVYDRFHRIDILINCVGKLIPGKFSSLSPSEIDQVVASNIFGIVFGARAVLPYMQARGKGTIINVGSLGGVVPMPFESLYSSMKFAVRGFSLSMHEELRGSGIDMCLLSPGSVRTRMLDLESGDDHSFISFTQKPMEPADAVAAIARLIERPRRELTIPPMSGIFARMVNCVPGLFGFCYPALQFFGARNILKYRKHNSIINAIGTSYETSGRDSH